MKISFWKVIAITSIFFAIVSAVMLFNVRDYNFKIQQAFEESISENIKIIKSLQVVSADNKQFFVTVNNAVKDSIKTKQETTYKDFMTKYYEIQSNWLNTWLTAIAIILALIAIIIPILFLKFNEKQETSLEKALEKVNKTDGLINKRLREYDEKMKQVMDSATKIPKENFAKAEEDFKKVLQIVQENKDEGSTVTDQEPQKKEEDK